MVTVFVLGCGVALMPCEVLSTKVKVWISLNHLAALYHPYPSPAVTGRDPGNSESVESPCVDTRVT